jgi:hypothetical protein
MWKDTTSYSQSEKERLPGTFTIKDENLTITITNGHIYHKGEWIMHCHKLGITEHVLGVKTELSAKVEALKVVGAKILKLRASLEHFIEKTEHGLE